MFVLILTLCSFGSCNGYVIATDTEWTTKAPCMQSLVRESDIMATVWDSGKKLESYLAPFNIQEALETLEDYDYTCEWVADNDIP